MRIEATYNGPAGSANGGWACGTFALAFGGAPAEVTLRLPPPLDTEYRVDGDGVYAGTDLVATVVAPVEVDVTPPPFPGVEAAREAETRYAGLHKHPFPTCFACGAARGDGLGLRPGPLGDTVATTWTPRGADERHVWAALDCPSGWALGQVESTPSVLGRLAARIDRPPRDGTEHVVVGWVRAATEGRKRFTASALYDAGGDVIATASATWIELLAHPHRDV